MESDEEYYDKADKSEKDDCNLDKYIIIKYLKEINYPLEIYDYEDFIQQLMSPTTLRISSIEWLIECLNSQVYTKLKEIMSENEKSEILAIIIYNLGIDLNKSYSLSELKKIIAGLATLYDSENFLLSLITFVKYFKSSNFSSSVKLISDCLMIVDYMSNNLENIFKDKIRLFAPEIKSQKEHEITFKNLEEKVRNFQKQIMKINRKLEKLKKYALSYENVDIENLMQLKQSLILFEKSMDRYLKDYNEIYSKDIKYISEDKISNLHVMVDDFLEKFNKLIAVSSSLEEVFSLHCRITNFEVK
jgi:hypothetical protein